MKQYITLWNEKLHIKYPLYYFLGNGCSPAVALSPLVEARLYPRKSFLFVLPPAKDAPQMAYPIYSFFGYGCTLAAAFSHIAEARLSSDKVNLSLVQVYRIWKPSYLVEAGVLLHFDSVERGREEGRAVISVQHRYAKKGRGG